ncbi:hypothetical protein EV182_005460, partial [Spiromyces aspiralis]
GRSRRAQAGSRRVQGRAPRLPPQARCHPGRRPAGLVALRTPEGPGLRKGMLLLDLRARHLDKLDPAIQPV